MPRPAGSAPSGSGHDEMPAAEVGSRPPLAGRVTTRGAGPSRGGQGAITRLLMSRSRTEKWNFSSAGSPEAVLATVVSTT